MLRLTLPRIASYHSLAVKFRSVEQFGRVRFLCEISKPRLTARTEGQNYGVLLDIDGVLIRGRKAIPGAKEALEALQQADVPTVFLTNGGCESEKEAAELLSSKIGFKVKEEQMVLSHTPLKMFDWLHDKHVLLSGQGPVKEIITGYGFRNVSDIDDARNAYPLLDMVDRTRRYQVDELQKEFPPVEAIILLGEPVRWETSLQLIIDLLVTNGNPGATPSSPPKKNIPVIAANTDLVYMSEASLPRFGHGAFLHCLECMYKKLTGQDLIYTLLLGKPYLTNYQYAEHSLHQLTGSSNSIKTLYAVGDNLDTDIYGANVCHEYLQAFHNGNGNINTQNDWMPEVKSIESVLVQTGISSASNKDESQFLHRDMIFNPKLRKANHVVKDIVEAVELILRQENSR